MPWYQDQNGEMAYKLSCYTKEDLPTWNEIYNVFYKRRITEYIPGVDEDQDPYWKLPLNEVIISMMANQFNKMLVEDGKMSDLVDYLHAKFGDAATIDSVYWIIFFAMEKEMLTIPTALTNLAMVYQENLSTLLFDCDGAKYPIIYDMPQPNGQPNPFIVNDHPRCDVTQMEGMRMLIPVYTTIDDKPVDIPYDEYLNACIEFMVAPMKDYFEGEKVGWNNMKNDDWDLNDEIQLGTEPM